MSNYNSPMNLAGSASRHSGQKCDNGYAMAALLIAMSVMAILLTVALPTWKQTIQREKEEELIFRGNQYARAISAYQRKYANASPQTLDVLVEQHYLRKKFKDPLAISEDGEFQPLYIQTEGTGSNAQGAGSSGTQGSGGSTAQAATAGTLASTKPSGGGIIGVASKNPGTSIREYNGHTHYNEWQFVPLQQSSRGGGGGQTGAAGQSGAAGQGGRGAQGTQGNQTGQGGRTGGQTQPSPTQGSRLGGGGTSPPR
jgi:type II secretory pathway pseudopilin PulG